MVGEKRENQKLLKFTPCPQRALLLHSAFTRLAQGWLKTFNHLHFFILRSQGWYRSIHYRSLCEALLFSSGIILDFDIEESCTFRLFSTSQPSAAHRSPPHPARSASRTSWHLVSPICSLPTALGLKTSVLIYFWMPMHLVVAHPFSIPPMQFTRHFHCLLFILRHRWTLFLKSMSLHSLSKVKYVTFIGNIDVGFRPTWSYLIVKVFPIPVKFLKPYVPSPFAAQQMFWLLVWCKSPVQTCEV